MKLQFTQKQVGAIFNDFAKVNGIPVEGTIRTGKMSNPFKDFNLERQEYLDFPGEEPYTIGLGVLTQNLNNSYPGHIVNGQAMAEMADLLEFFGLPRRVNMSWDNFLSIYIFPNADKL